MIEKPDSLKNLDIEQKLVLFRPLLQALHLQNVSEKPTFVKVIDFRKLTLAGIRRCIVTVQRKKISEDKKGYFVFIHKKK